MVTGLLSGSTPAMPSNGFSLVDVRDVAALHVAALQQSTSIGERFLATSDYVSFPEVGCILAAAYPDRAITQKTVPDWIIKIMARFGGVIRQIINISATKNTTTTARAKSCWVGYFCRKKTLSSPAPKVGCDCSRRRRSAADLPARDRPALLRAMHAARLTMVLLIAAAGSACLTPYHPKASPRVQVIDAVGVRTYAKDGVVVVDGPFGGTLYDLIKDNPRARNDAIAHQIDIAISVALGATSIAASGTGVVLLASQQQELAVPGIAAVVVGVAAAIPATILQLTADTHLWRAINVYNDELAEPAPQRAQ